MGNAAESCDAYAFQSSSVSPGGRFCVFGGKKDSPPSGQDVGETARKPDSKPLSVSPCLRPLRVDRPEAGRTSRDEGGAGPSRAEPRRRATSPRTRPRTPATRRRKMRFHRVIILEAVARRGVTSQKASEAPFSRFFSPPPLIPPKKSGEKSGYEGGMRRPLDAEGPLC